MSKMAYFSIGFILFYQVANIHSNKLILILIFLIIFISYYCGYFKVFSLFLASPIIILQSFIFIDSIDPLKFKIQDKDILLAQKTIQIQFKKEIKRNFYETEIQFKSFTFKIILKSFRRDSSLPTLKCRAENISIHTANSEEEYYRFLKDWNYLYVKIRETNCETITTSIDPKKRFRQSIEETLNRSGINDYANDIAMGLFFGDSNYLNKEFKERVREGGVLHLFAASGLHIGVFIGFLFLIAKQIWFLNYYTERIFPLLIAFSYLYLLDFPVSLVRAYIFTSFLVLGSLFFRKMKSIDLILISAFCILIIEPDNFLTLSFTLSYSAVSGILFLKNSLDSLLFKNTKNFFTENFTISLAASLGTYPVLLFYFKSFSFGSIFLNLLLVPLTSLLLPLLYISLLLQIIYEFYFDKIGFLFWEWKKNRCEIFEFTDLLTILFQYLTEIFWTYSELLLRTLAFLSENLSETIGFYRSVKNSLTFHLSLYLVLFGILVLGFLLMELPFFKDSAKKKKLSHRRKFLSVFSFFSIVAFFILGYLLFPENQNSNLTKEVKANSEYFLIREENEVYLGGKCKYSKYEIQKQINGGFCDGEITSIIIEDESCLFLANLCRKTHSNTTIYSTQKISGWSETYSYFRENPDKIKRKFSGLLVFYPHLDSLYELQKNAKTDNGKILLLFAYKLKDSAKDWNENKNVLGINGNWNFITPDEL